MEKIGIFAGKGGIVSLAVNEIKKRGKEPVMFSFYDMDVPGIKFYKIGFGALDEFLYKARKEGVSRIILVGKIHPQEIFKKPLDASGGNFIKSLKTFVPEDILLNLVRYIEKHHIRTIPLTNVFRDCIAMEKMYSNEKPGPKDLVDIDFSWKIAKYAANKKIGQAVSVKNGMVIAVEGIEGTDEMIKRSGNYCEDFTVMKVIRAGQSTKFDLPTVGPDTVKNFVESKGRVLVFEAGKTIILDEEKIKDMADKNKIIVLGYKGRKNKHVN